MRRDLLLLLSGVAIGMLIPLPHHDTPQHLAPHTRERLDSTAVIVTQPGTRLKLAAKAITRHAPNGDALHTIDTVLLDRSTGRSDTITITHVLPEDSFHVEIVLAPSEDTVIVPYVAKDSVYTAATSIEENWFVRLVKQLAIFLVGLLVGKTL